MAIELRQYQKDVKEEADEAWTAGAKNVLIVLPTGAGKTVTFSDIVRDNRGASCSIAHRQELVTQISLALARDGIYHRIIGPSKVVRQCVRTHMEEVGKSFYNSTAIAAVAGVDTLVNRADELSAWLNSVTLWVQDEAHHVLKDNKWGRAADMFPNARGLGVTATPLRADGKGLGRDAEGLFDVMVEGPGMRDLIKMGFLTDYRIFAPKSDIDLSEVNISKVTGDYSKNKLTNAVRKSKIVGDVVSHYLRIAPGKSGVTFATDVQTATDIAEQFNAAGVPAEVVSAKTADAERSSVVGRFRRRELLQLVNVDLFGEGFDLPAIEVVSMARPTQSYGLYVQQFGRALRIMEGKTEAIIIDHVGNVDQTNGRGHGLPDRKRVWSLNSQNRKARAVLLEEEIPVRACPECTGVYERIHSVCPYCGYKPLPMARSGPEFVDGDLTELDPETLARMRGEVEHTDMDKEDFRTELVAKHVPVQGQLSQVKKHVENQEAQTILRNTIAWWAGYQRHAQKPESESYRSFYFKFGIDAMGAKSLKAKDALLLNEKITKEIQNAQTL